MFNYLKVVYPSSEILIDVTNSSASKIQKLHRFFKKMNPVAISYIVSSTVGLECDYSED